MRDFLFRGKAIEEKAGVNIGDWVHGSLFISTLDEVYIFELGIDEKIEVDPTTVGQYTGLKDIKGNKLFEGDIFKLSTWYGEDFGIVRWDEERAEFYIETKKDFYDVVAIPSETEIVGNKWDNPELLKGKETSLKDEDIYLHSQIEKFSDAVAECDNLLKAAEENGIRLETRNYEKGYAVEVKIRRIATADEIRDMWRRNGGVKL